jgi:hypothetical protein
VVALPCIPCLRQAAQGYANRKQLTYYATFLIFLKTFSFLREIPLPWAFFVKLENLFPYD